MRGEKERGYLFHEATAPCNTPHEEKIHAAAAFKVASIFFRMKGLKKWIFERKYYRLPNW